MGSELIIKLSAAVLFGGIIGLERELHGKPAGLRTHILVCLGATLLVLLPEAICPSSSNDRGLPMETGRIMAGIVTGIGFLGAGVIMREGDVVRGLTTAAGIWFTSVLGIVIGGGQFGLALAGTILCLLVLIGFDRIEHRMPSLIRRQVQVTFNEDRVDYMRQCIRTIFNDHGVRIHGRSFSYNRDTGLAKIGYTVRLNHRDRGTLVIDALRSLEDVHQVTWE